MSNCPSCERYMPYREATVFDEHGPYCGGCEQRAMDAFEREFIREVLFEDECERSAFFPRNYRFADDRWIAWCDAVFDAMAAE